MTFDYLAQVNAVLEDNRKSIVQVREDTKRLAETIQALVKHIKKLEKEVQELKSWRLTSGH